MGHPRTDRCTQFIEQVPGHTSLCRAALEIPPPKLCMKNVRVETLQECSYSANHVNAQTCRISRIPPRLLRDVSTKSQKFDGTFHEHCPKVQGCNCQGNVDTCVTRPEAYQSRRQEEQKDTVHDANWRLRQRLASNISWVYKAQSQTKKRAGTPYEILHCFVGSSQRNIGEQ